MVHAPAKDGPSLRASVVLFCGFLVICLGLGYATLNRYDPRVVGNTDSIDYYRMIEPSGDVPPRAPYAYRLLTPTLARGVLKIVSQFDFYSWDRVFLSLLVVNSVFAALTAVLIMQMTAEVVRDVAVIGLAPLVYLSSFAVVNFHLAGLVDAGEGFFLTALLLALLRRRWLPMPVLIALGTAAKETVLPLGLCGMVVGWVVCRVRRTPPPRSAPAVMAVSLAVGLGSVWLCRSLAGVPPSEAHRFSWARLAEMFPHAVDCLLTKTQLYVFAFLLPLGIARLRRIPVPLLAASGGMALLAWLLGGYAGIGDNLHRPLFNTLGPVLVVSSSIFLRDLIRGNRRDLAETPTPPPDP